MKLRDYQNDALLNVKNAYERGVHRVLISLFVGAGKTVLASALPLVIKPKKDDVMCILVNRDELVGQTITKLRAMHPNGIIGIEKANKRAEGDANFIVASVQTLHEKRLDELYERFHNKIGILLIDECHHAVAQSYRAITDRFFSHRSDGLLVGITATPQRTDGTGLGTLFDEVVMHHDMKWGIDNGYLVDISCYRVSTKTHLDDVASRGGDYAIDELSHVIDTVDRNDIVVSAYKQHTPGKKAIAFCPTVNHAKHLCEAFLAHGIPAAWACGSTARQERSEIIKNFRTGKIRVLVNAQLFTEGFDVPDAEVLIGCRPTQSTSMYIQMCGRVMRPLDGVASLLSPDTSIAERKQFIATSNKPFATILDIVDQTKKHNLVTLPTLWGLPPGLDTQGKNLNEIANDYEKLAEKNPLATKSVSTPQDIQTEIEKINAWEIPVQPPEIIAISSLSWRMVGESIYRLPLPPSYYAEDINGVSIQNFSKRYRACLFNARKQGIPHFDVYAQQQLHYDKKTFREIQEHIEIRPGILDVFEVILLQNSKIRILGSTPTLHEAFTRGERWIENNRKDLFSSLSARAPWRNAPPSDTQIKTLNTKFHVPFHIIPTTRGEASALIAKLIDKNKTQHLPSPKQ